MIMRDKLYMPSVDVDIHVCELQCNLFYDAGPVAIPEWLLYGHRGRPSPIPRRSRKGLRGCALHRSNRMVRQL